MFKQIFRVMILLLCIFCLASCNKDNHIHSFTEEVVEPSCTKEGYVKITCECGYCSEEVIEKLPHHFVEGKCICGEVEVIKVSFVPVNTCCIIATCSGNTQTSTCCYRLSILKGFIEN